MYERSAIVLERYFEKLLEYRRECNLRDNFINYCELIEKLEKYQANYQKEFTATQDFSESVRKVKSIQELQDKLYKRSVKLEYNRNLLFNNVDAKVEEIKRCIEKVEDDVSKNNEAMIEIKESLLEALTDYNDKRYELSKCKRYKKMAENAYNECIEKTRANFEGITDEIVEKVKEFANFDDIDDIINTLEVNGKDEKIPFNEGVITNATNFGVELAKKEAYGYLVIYEKMQNLLDDIDNGTTQVENYKKVLIDEKSKMDFLYASKDYIFQFLDYERMTVIHGRKSHNRLMNEACENFNQDVQQINNLYTLLEKEIENKATKKSYTDLYNKSYLKDIQDKEEKFKREKNRVNLNTATLINSNYWRIDGIKAIYTVFYNSVSVALGKVVDEFDMPKEVDEDQIDENDEDISNDYQEETTEMSEDNSEEKEDNEEKAPKKEVKIEKKVPKAPKVPFAIETTIEEILAEAEDIEELDDEDLEDENGELDVKSITQKAKQISSNKSNKTIKSIIDDDDDDVDVDVDEDSEDIEDIDNIYENNDKEDIDIDDEDEYEDDKEDEDDEEETKKASIAKNILTKKKSIKEEPKAKKEEPKVIEEDDEEDEEDEDDEDDFDIFGEKYKNIDFSENSFLKNNKKSFEEMSKVEDDEYDDYEDDDEEEAINDDFNKKDNITKDEDNEEDEDNFNDDIDDELEEEIIVKPEVKKKSTIPEIRKKSNSIPEIKKREVKEEPEENDETPKRGRRKNGIEDLDLDSLREAQKALQEITGKKRGRKRKTESDIW